jgi:hypothetical protein
VDGLKWLCAQPTFAQQIVEVAEVANDVQKDVYGVLTLLL